VPGRIAADKQVVAVMIRIYCEAHHRTKPSNSEDSCMHGGIDENQLATGTPTARHLEE